MHFVSFILSYFIARLLFDLLMPHGRLGIFFVLLVVLLGYLVYRRFKKEGYVDDLRAEFKEHFSND